MTVIRPDGGRTLRRAAALPVVELNGSPVGPGSVPLVEGDIVSLAR